MLPTDILPLLTLVPPVAALLVVMDGRVEVRHMKDVVWVVDHCDHGGSNVGGVELVEQGAREAGGTRCSITEDVEEGYHHEGDEKGG